MLDVLYGYLALYLVDVVRLDPETASLGVAVWTGVGLVGDFLLIPLLERVRGLEYLRLSVLIELTLFPAFLLAPGLAGKLVLLGLLGFFNSGWYSVLQGQLYSSMPGQSGTVLTLTNLVGWVGQLVPLAIGLTAERFGLANAMWLLLLGPLALIFGIPRRATPILGEGDPRPG
jgi:FSR family fosmidomycin resistance protein-like MFS transporter